MIEINYDAGASEQLLLYGNIKRPKIFCGQAVQARYTNLYAQGGPHWTSMSYLTLTALPLDK